MEGTIQYRTLISVLPIDPPRAIDKISHSHSLLLAKLEAYSFSANSLKLLQSYLSKRFQQTHLNGSFSKWAQISAGVLQCSTLGSLLSNIVLIDIFFLFINNSNLCNYADDNTLYTIRKNLDKLKLDLQSNFSILQKRFYENHIALSPGKYHYMLLGGHSKIDY